MAEVSVESISYQIITEAQVVIQCCDDSVTTLLPRNCIPFCANRARVAHLTIRVLRKSTTIMLIPYSIFTIFGGCEFALMCLQSLAFEFGSELSSISSSIFRIFSVSSIFIPQSVCFIGYYAFLANNSITCVHFDRNSSLIQLKSGTFCCSSHLSMITIPASVKQIH
jgi:hypothetical protein